MIFTVRKRPIPRGTENGKRIRPGGGVIYLPAGVGLINTRVKVLVMKEYWELKRRSDVYERVQKLTEEPWVVTK